MINIDNLIYSQFVGKSIDNPSNNIVALHQKFNKLSIYYVCTYICMFILSFISIFFDSLPLLVHIYTWQLMYLLVNISSAEL